MKKRATPEERMQALHDRVEAETRKQQEEKEILARMTAALQARLNTLAGKLAPLDWLPIRHESDNDQVGIERIGTGRNNSYLLVLHKRKYHGRREETRLISFELVVDRQGRVTVTHDDTPVSDEQVLDLATAVVEKYFLYAQQPEERV